MDHSRSKRYRKNDVFVKNSSTAKEEYHILTHMVSKIGN